MTAGDYMFNNFTLSRVEPRAHAQQEEEEEEPSIVMVHNPQDHQEPPQLPNVPHLSQAAPPLPSPRSRPAKAPQKWRVRRRSSADIRSGQAQGNNVEMKKIGKQQNN